VLKRRIRLKDMWLFLRGYCDFLNSYLEGWYLVLVVKHIVEGCLDSCY